MPDDRLHPPALAATRDAIRRQQPLVHNLTSAVVANFTANALLAIGASPAMVEAMDEAVAFARLADAVVINLGSLTPLRQEVMLVVAEAAKHAGTPFVLDPVAAGAIAQRTAFAQALCRIGPSAIRGNASEILALSGASGGGRGVDSLALSEAAIEAAQALARDCGAIVAVTGQVDYVTDGNETVAVRHGHEMMTRVTGMGCAASALVAACLGVETNRLQAVAHALAFSGIAGEIAASMASGPGSLAMHYLDALSGDLAQPQALPDK
jgi:hydroxyethylthiazole kinase